MLTHVYYSLKPYVPWRLRLAIRRVIARRKRQQHQATWPILPSAATPPPNWPGWPEGKKFAFVITHDVEDVGGLNKCRELYALEAGLGFRSSFNFIPEGPYRVSPELRAELDRAGFEVGIHDLRHDGKLFRSRSEFSRSAQRINSYIREWSASGYRSGFMLRRLDWLHDLNIIYDASTFDTDPFEPQPDGCGSIFPYWIPHPDEAGANLGPAGRGYVELPYSLPQDSTLFLVLGETSPDIWIRKLDWVARHGGMALVNVHPDYVNFSDRATAREFPASFYSQLLRYVAAKYSDEFWNPLPRDLAAWFRKTHDCGSIAR